MPVITIRPATADDIETIDRLLGELASSLGESGQYRGDLEALRRHGFSSRPVFRALLAERGTEAVGLALYFQEFSTWHCRAGVYVQDLFVAPGERGGGIGRRLLAAAIADAADRWDASYLRLAVHVMNHDARDFYHALGFIADTDNQVMKLAGDAFASVASSDRDHSL